MSALSEPVDMYVAYCRPIVNIKFLFWVRWPLVISFNLSTLTKELVEKKALAISEVMSNVAHKLAHEGDAQLVRGDVNAAKKMLEELSNRLELI